MSFKFLALLMILSTSAFAGEVVNLLNLGATIGQQNPTYPTNPTYNYPTYNYNLSGSLVGPQRSYFSTIPVGEVHEAVPVSDVHGAVPVSYINTLDLSNWRGIDPSVVPVYEKPCMGYGGCSGTGISSGYGVNYKSKIHSQPYNMNTYSGFMSPDNNIPYINNSNRSSIYKFQFNQYTPAFSTIPSASSK